MENKLKSNLLMQTLPLEGKRKLHVGNVSRLVLAFVFQAAQACSQSGIWITSAAEAIFFPTRKLKHITEIYSEGEVVMLKEFTAPK
jgi:hypothetical protein